MAHFLAPVGRDSYTWDQILERHGVVVVDTGPSRDGGHQLTSTMTQWLTAMMGFTAQAAVERTCFGWRAADRSVWMLCDEFKYLAGYAPEVAKWWKDDGHMQLAKEGSKIIHWRKNFVEKIGRISANIHNKITDGKEKPNTVNSSKGSSGGATLGTFKKEGENSLNKETSLIQKSEISEDNKMSNEGEDDIKKQKEEKKEPPMKKRMLPSSRDPRTISCHP